MGTVQSPTYPNGDTLPYAPGNQVPVSTGAGWTMQPSYCGSVNATSTVTNSTNIDFTTGTIFQYTLTTAQTWFPLFANQTNGQTVRIITKQPAGAAWTYVVWPAGITFVGGLKVLSSVTGGTDVFDVTCVSQSTFIGNALQHLS